MFSISLRLNKFFPVIKRMQSSILLKGKNMQTYYQEILN